MDDDPEGGRGSKDILQWFISLSAKDKLILVTSVIMIAAISITSVVVLHDGNSEEFTEFYVLNAEGKAYGYPQMIEVGNNSSIILGIANHEGRLLQYTAEVWLVNYTLIDMAVNVTQMYYVERFTVVLESVDYQLTGNWVPQFEREVMISPQHPGNFTLLLLLFLEDTQPNPEPQPYDPSFNYYQTEASWRVVMCVNNEITHLKLVLDVPQV